MTPTFRALRVMTLPQRLCATAVATGFLVAMFASPARADELADVSRLMRGGQYGDALSKADSFLATKPRDAQMRFLKGVILTEQNKTADAITVFSRLTEEFPELPEPYNNLAVLYAGSGQYEKARVALDKAIRTNPSYATAYENLGDIHAKLASEAYDKALQLDSGNSGAKSKLTLVRSLVSAAPVAGGKPVQTNQSVAQSRPTPLPPIAAAPLAPSVPAPSAASTAQPAPAAATPRLAAPTPAATSPVVPPLARLEPSRAEARTDAKIRPEPKPESRPTVSDNAERDAVLASVHGWAGAWSARDVKSYLNYYGAEFQPPKGMSRKAWSEERESRIAGKGRINVKVETPQVHIEGNTATVKFRQAYSSDRLSSSSRKTLVLVKNHGKWQIRNETTGS
jgi:tetratricopeptide (TPR) repeat protein